MVEAAVEVGIDTVVKLGTAAYNFIKNLAEKNAAKFAQAKQRFEEQQDLNERIKLAREMAEAARTQARENQISRMSKVIYSKDALALLGESGGKGGAAAGKTGISEAFAKTLDASGKRIYENYPNSYFFQNEQKFKEEMQLADQIEQSYSDAAVAMDAEKKAENAPQTTPDPKGDSEKFSFMEFIKTNAFYIIAVIIALLGLVFLTRSSFSQKTKPERMNYNYRGGGTKTTAKGDAARKYAKK